MNFASIHFLILLLISVVVLAFAGCFNHKYSQKFRHIYLLITSYIFYGWWDWHFCFLMLLLTTIAYVTARQLNGKYRKISIIIGVSTPIVILGIFKYLNFFLDSFSVAFGIEKLCSLNIILPVGISFYTFQSMSYTLDVYRDKIKAANFIDVALYVSFFPQLVAGPIVKAQDFLPQLKEKRRITLKGLEIGLQIFVMGMFKKIVLADRLSVFVDDVFATPAAFSSLTVILAIIAYALQIYFDFSGYSDMAIGSAKCLGYDIQRNFNLPYISKNPTEFWKRWHISLSTWLQEYLYIPLGGNRKGTRRTYINLMLTMLIGGLWHGANWTFVIWGALHGMALCIHKLYLKIFSTKIRIPIVSSIIMNNVFVCLCWVFFRATSFSVAVEILEKVFIWSDGIQQLYMWLFFALAIKIIYITWCTKKSKVNKITDSKIIVNAFYFHHNLNTILGLFLFFLEIMAIIGFAYTAANPFIYFQF